MRYLILGTALLVACAQPAKEPSKPDVAAIRKAIETSNAGQTAAIVKGDIPGAIAPYTADALVFNPGAPMANGRAEIQKMFEDMLGATTVKEFTLIVSDVIVAGSGDLAVEYGRYTWTVEPKGGKPMPDGRELSIPPGNRLHALRGTRRGQHSIRLDSSGGRFNFMFF